MRLPAEIVKAEAKSTLSWSSYVAYLIQVCMWRLNLCLIIGRKFLVYERQSSKGESKNYRGTGESVPGKEFGRIFICKAKRQDSQQNLGNVMWLHAKQEICGPDTFPQVIEKYMKATRKCTEYC